MHYANSCPQLFWVHIHECINLICVWYGDSKIPNRLHNTEISIVYLLLLSDTLVTIAAAYDNVTRSVTTDGHPTV